MSTASTIVIFGATGDLTRRKLIPALYNNTVKGNLPDNTQIVGFSIEDYSVESLRQRLQEGVKTFSPDTYDETQWAGFANRIHYVQGDLTEADDFTKLDKTLQGMEGGPADRLYYLAISPTLYPVAVENLGHAGMASEKQGRRSIIIEKPFGHDLASAQSLNNKVHSVFAERQVYRIDHYLGKETAQNILFFRFANHVFESVWDRSHIVNVQITVTETVDVGHRAGYYDKAGVLRDMFQNHLLQLVALVAMEPPSSFSADALRNEKVKVLQAIRSIDLQDTVRGQYEGYTETEGVDSQSITPTYAALKLHVDNWRWQGVPFYLRSGKSLARKATEIVIQFESPPRRMFDMPGFNCDPNTLSLCIQPDEGIHFKFQTKVPASSHRTYSADMEFHYDDTFGEGAIPEAYERLLLDAIQGDASLFIRSDEIETAWQLMDPIINGWSNGDGPELETYPAGSWGPSQADLLLARDRFLWNLGCVHD